MFNERFGKNSRMAGVKCIKIQLIKLLREVWSLSFQSIPDTLVRVVCESTV